MRWPRRRPVPSPDDRVMNAVAAETARIMQNGCCCPARISVHGWAKMSTGLCPVLTVEHTSWCPLPRSLEGGERQRGVTFVNADERSGS